MEAFDNSSSITKIAWKRFRIVLAFWLLLFIFYEFDIIEIGSFLFGLGFWILLPVSIFFLVEAIWKCYRYKSYPGLLSILLGGFLMLAVPVIMFYRTGFFWGTPIVTGAFIDDRSRMDIQFYKNGKYILTEGWMLGSEQYEGTYHTYGDTIEVSFFPFAQNGEKMPKLFRRNNKIFFPQNGLGEYDTSYDFFEIEPEQDNNPWQSR